MPCHVKNSPISLMNNPPSMGLSPPEAEAVCRLHLQGLTAKTITIWKFPHNSRPDSWPVCFTVGGGQATFWSPCLPPLLQVKSTAYNHKN